MVKPNNGEYASLPREKESKPYAFFSFLLILFFTNSLFLATFADLSDYFGHAGWHDSLEIYSLILSFMLGGYLILLAHRRLGAKPNYFLIGLFSILTITTAISYIWLAPVTKVPYGYGEVITIDEATHYRFCGMSVNSMFTLFILFAYAPCAKKGRGGWFLLMEVFVCFALASFIFSLIREWDKYVYILQTHSIDDQHSPLSWLTHKNVYGRFLLIGIMAELYLIYMDRRHIRYITVGILFIALFTSMAKTPILIAGASLLLFLVFMGVLEFKTRRRMAYVQLGIAATGILALFILTILPEGSLGALSGLMKAFIHDFQGDGGSMDLRQLIWEKSFRLYHQGLPQNRIFGFGDASFSVLIGPAIDFGGYVTGSSHNAWIEMLMRGGIIRLIGGVLITCYVLFYIGKGIYKKQPGAYLSLIFLLGFGFHSSMESLFLLDCSLESMAYTLMIIMPILGKNPDALPETRGKEIQKKDLLAAGRNIGLMLLPLALGLAFALPSKIASAILMVLILAGQGFIILFRRNDNRLIAYESICAVVSDILAVVLFCFFPMRGTVDYALMALGVFVCSMTIQATFVYIIPERYALKVPHPIEDFHDSLLAWEIRD